MLSADAAQLSARCVVFLASGDAGFITGSTLSANGGQVMI
jgi:acetoacetyl-CoA reductase